MKITNARILGPDFRFFSGSMEFEGNIISALTASEGSENDGNADVSNDGDIVDLKGMTVIPGLIDVHMHGFGGVACSDPDPKQIRLLGQRIVQRGVTGYAATISSCQDEKAVRSIRNNTEVKKQEEVERTGARILGIHMEGPFLNIVKKGGMDANNIFEPSIDRLQLYLDTCGDDMPLVILTVAPEMPGAEKVIRHAVSNGVKVSMGHTMATEEEALKGIEWGASRQTHTFNAERALDHREIGVLGVSLTDDRVQCEMITDFVHLNKKICLMIYRLKGVDKVTMISDSFQLAGVPQEMIPEGIPVVIKDAAYLTNGTLCGSIITVMEGVRNLVSIGIPLEDAVKMASYNPARDCGCENEVGSLDIGKKADFVVLDDALKVKAVYIDGKKIVEHE